MERYDSDSGSSEEETAPTRRRPTVVKADSTSITKKNKKEKADSGMDSDRDENGTSYKKQSLPEYPPDYNDSDSDDSEMEAPPLKKVKHQRKKTSFFDVMKKNRKGVYKCGRTSRNGTVWLDTDSDDEKLSVGKKTVTTDSTKGDGRNSEGEEEFLNDEGVKTGKKESESGSSEEMEDGKATQPSLKSVKSRKAAKPEREDSDSSDEPDIEAKTKKTVTTIELGSDDSEEREASVASQVVNIRRKTVEEKTSRPVVSDSSENDTESFVNSAKILVMLKRMANRRDDSEPEVQSPELIPENRKRRKPESAYDGLTKLKVLKCNKPKAAKRLQFYPSSEDTADSE